MKNRALWLLLCGCMASVSSAAIADTSVAVKQVSMTSTQLDEEKSPKFTDDQLERMHSIKSKFEDSRGARAVEIHKLHRQIFDTLSTSNIDKASVLATQGKINALEGQQANERVQMLLDMHDILTPEQRQVIRHHLLDMDMRTPVGPGVIALPSAFGGARLSSTRNKR